MFTCGNNFAKEQEMESYLILMQSCSALKLDAGWRVPDTMVSLLWIMFVSFGN